MTVQSLYELSQSQRRPVCVECGRTFDLMDEVDAGEWFYGHDCEVA
jgi:hypothetical protein